MNYFKIVYVEQQTMLFDRVREHVRGGPCKKTLYAKIAKVDEQHVSQYDFVGDLSLPA